MHFPSCPRKSVVCVFPQWRAVACWRWRMRSRHSRTFASWTPTRRPTSPWWACLSTLVCGNVWIDTSRSSRWLAVRSSHHVAHLWRSASVGLEHARSEAGLSTFISTLWFGKYRIVMANKLRQFGALQFSGISGSKSQHPLGGVEQIVWYFWFCYTTVGAPWS